MLLQILKTVGILLEVILLFNIIIVVHELGHFLAARWRGLVVEKFGIWFGKPIWKKKIGGVEYSLGSIPAGGFVSLPQLAPMEAIEGQTDADRHELPKVSAWDKIIVAFAGPLFSFGLAILFAVIVWLVGRPVSEGEATRFIGHLDPASPAYAAGLRPGDEILEVDNRPVKRFGGMSESVVWNVVSSQGETIPITVRRGEETLTFDPEPLQQKAEFLRRKPPRQTPMIGKVNPGSPAAVAGLQENDLVLAVDGVPVLHELQLAELSTDPARPTVVWTIRRGEQTLELPVPASRVGVAEVFPDGPAAAAGLQAGDQILAAAGAPVRGFGDIVERIAADPKSPIILEVERAGLPVELTAQPAMEVNLQRPVLGFAFQPPLSELGIAWDNYGLMEIVHPRPDEQIRGAALTIFNMLGALFSPKSNIKPEHLSGPVGIMRMYYLLFDSPYGWQAVLWFSVILNVNLALLNLLPIPVLDGGHITLAIIEAIRKKPINLRVLEVVQTGCALLLIGFMVFVTFFDVQDLPIPGMQKSEQKMEFTPIDAGT